MQDGQFDELCGNGEYIDVARVKKDYKRLLKDCRPVVNYVNKRIAHRTDVDVDLTMQQIHTAMDAVEEILKKYYVTLTGARHRTRTAPHGASRELRTCHQRSWSW